MGTDSPPAPAEPPTSTRSSRWSRIPSGVMWVTTVAASVAGILVALNEIGVFSKSEPAAAPKAEPAAAPAAVATPDASVVAARPVVASVRLTNGLKMRGFFSPRGELITMRGAEGGTATWDDGPARVRATLALVTEGDSLSTYRPTSHDAPVVAYPIRNGASLRTGDTVVQRLGPTEETVGRVIEMRSGTVVELHTGNDRALLTSPISSLADRYTPVLDDQGRLIGVSASASDTETWVVLIEDVRAEFPDAF